MVYRTELSGFSWPEALVILERVDVPLFFVPRALVLYNAEVRRAFSSYWWVMDCLWGGPLPERWGVSA